MTNEELRKWFFDKYNSCYPVVHDDIVYLIYDKQFIRQRKMTRVLGHEIDLPTVHNNGICLFYQDYKNQYFRCNYFEIWLFFYANYINNYNQVQCFIKRLLCEYDKLNSLTPGSFERVCQETRNKLGLLTVSSLP